MATSGTTDFAQNRNQIIYASLRKMGIYARGEPIPAESVQNAVGDFNRLIKSWNKMGYHLWRIQHATLFYDTLSPKYTISDTGANCTLTSDLYETVLAADALSGATSISVADADGFVVDKYIGIVQSNQTMHWTNIASVIGTTIGLDSPLTADADTETPVYVYQTKLKKPLRITEARTRIYTTEPNQSDITMTKLSMTDYFGLPNKTAQGVPVQFFYQPNRTDGDFYIWPVNNVVTYRAEFSFESSIEDAGDITDDIDFPIEWSRALVWNLAFELATEYGVDDSTYLKLEKRAAEELADAAAWDIEDASVQLAPDFYYGDYTQGYYR